MTVLDNSFVFREDASGNLEFVGDFEGLYKAEKDPWEQSADSDEYAIRRYYQNSRIQLLAALRRRVNGSGVRGLEIGCGHGHVVDCLASLTTNTTWHGADISSTAIARARELYPQHTFFTADITESIRVSIRYDIVVLGQLLWYVMHEMDRVVENCANALVPSGLLVVSQAFLTSPQRYGRQYIDGFDGAVRALLRYPNFYLLEARYEDRLGLAHNDGLIILRKR